jgi:hypothetical protein
MLDRVIETVETYLRTVLASVPQACPKPTQQGRRKGAGTADQGPDLWWGCGGREKD